MFFGMWIFLFFYRMSALGNPPYWDSILGMFQEGIWLYENDFNYLKLAREELGYLAGGPRTYFFSWLPGFYAVLMHVFPTVKSTFVFLHVLNFFFAAALAGMMVRLLHKRVGYALAIGTSLAMCLQPMFIAQASMMGSDLMLAGLCLLGFWLYVQRKHAWAIITMIVAVTVKPMPALMSICLAGGFVLFHLKTRRDLLLLAGYLVPVIYFSGWARLAAWLFFRPDTNPIGNDTFFPAGASRLEYLREQTHMMFNQVPDVMALVLGVLLLHVGLILWRVRKNVLKPLSWRACLLPYEMPLILALALGGLILESILIVSWLPRYLLFLYPAIFILLALALKPLPAKISLPFLGLLMVFFSANHHGRFYRSPALNNGYILERSLEYEEDLHLNREIASTLAADYPDRTVLAHWPQAQILAHPGFGYVAEPLDVIAVNRPAMAWAGIPYFGELALEQKRAAGNIWLDANNLFGTNLGIRPGLDHTLETFTSGTRSARLWEKTFGRTF